ncbi:MAG: MATE family efflux transporter [Hyphomicrobiaceae bacterium]|nr:MATE family efflux transporter [Hyphomicrobiaceae bacterium]
MVTGRRSRPAAGPPKFVTGPVLRHIIEMTAAGALGLMAIFLGDLANIYFLSVAGDETVVAAIGYASSILFFSTSIGIGLSIAASSVVSPAVGANVRSKARRLSTHTHVLAFGVSAIVSLVMWFFIPWLLEILGAKDRTHALASIYLEILIPTMPLIALGITSSAVLRSVGDAKRAMFVTLAGAVVNVILDAILILKLGWGVEGAAISSVLARFAIFAVGIYGVVGVHRLWGAVKPDVLWEDARLFFRIGVPAMLTNIATPVGNAYVTMAVSAFGNDAVSGWAVIGRIIPVAFGAVYALSGAVGPIVGQNLGARKPERMRAILTQSLLVMAAFTLAAWIILSVLAEPMAISFNASGQARELIIFFCRALSPMFVFLGAIFIANATFNVLGKPHLSTALNWARATLGTVPFVALGARFDGARGALTGQMLGGVIFGLLAVALSYRLVARITLSMRQP